MKSKRYPTFQFVVCRYRRADTVPIRIVSGRSRNLFRASTIICMNVAMHTPFTPGASVYMLGFLVKHAAISRLMRTYILDVRDSVARPRKTEWRMKSRKRKQ